ncbi:SGNH/GDSL hydrolase family protein [Rubritalea tangerina]|uniref:SGNH/GDSL hydrolase family protein n=1 Tax=Rubritalea tangerina TaxID=430798 RepID=UPI003607B319
MPSLLLAAASQDSPSHRKLLLESDRIVFLGDSITYKGDYVSNFETWLKALYSKRNFDVVNLGLPSETVSGLSENGHAGGKFPRPDLFTRLDSVLEKTKPDLIFACYGMNCGIYQPLDEQRFQKYKDGISKLKKKAEESGATIIFLTPATFDSKRKPKQAHYAEVLNTYADWLVSQRQNGWLVIDIHSHMRNALDEEQKQNPTFTYQKDAIHPNSAGHWS